MSLDAVFETGEECNNGFLPSFWFMIGITPYREQGYKDPLLVEVMLAPKDSWLPLREDSD